MRHLLPLLPLLILCAPAAADDLPAWAKKAQGRFAYSHSFKGQKIGYTIEDTKLGKHDGKDVLTVISRDYFAFLYEGEKSVKDETTTCHYELAGDGPLLFARRQRVENGQTLTAELTRRGKGMRLTVRQPKRRPESRDVTLPKDTLAVARAYEAWLAGPRKAGDTFTKYAIAWDGEDEGHVDRAEAFTFGKKTTAKAYGENRPAFAVQIVISGAKLAAEVLPDGRLVSWKMGKLTSLTLEKEEVATKLGPPPELMEAACVPLAKDLSPPHLVDGLKLEVKGLGDFALPASHRQVVTKEKDRVVVQLKRDFRVEKAAPLTKEERKAYLATSPRLQCDDAQIVARAKVTVGDETDALKKARAIERWVFVTLKKSYSENARRATDVLAREAGACREHSLLFVALARAAGVPAREVGGLVFTRQNDKSMMGWHVWAEVHDGRQWVSVDPTWGQVYVDATHVKMMEGERDQSWANVAAELAIEVVEVARRR